MKLPPMLATAGSTVLLLLSAARADDGSHAQPFWQGTIFVVAQVQDDDLQRGQIASVTDRETLDRFNRDTVGDALNLLSGVSIATNSRNEKTVAVRGFDARQVPLFIDGIPVYVPYDGYVDFNRFTTADIAAIQVAKGFSSVVYGANTLGGAINLVSRKPAAPLEADVSLGAGAGQRRKASATIGTNQGSWYLQSAISTLRSDGFALSDDFVPTPTEDGGLRDNARQEDRKISLKFGLTPDNGDEYALSYYRQEGEKGQPPSTNPAAARYWRWPFWDKESLYFIANASIGADDSLRLRLYHDRYDNEVDSYTDGTYRELRISGPGSVGTGRSIYHDRSNGGSLQWESQRSARHHFSLITHFKTDRHQELDANARENARFEDRFLSLSAEDNIALRERLQLSLGAAHHRLEPESVFSRGNPYSLPTAQSATDLQAGLFLDSGDSSRWYATLARKSRLPTLKDRYSQRLGTYIENPALQSERSFNYEIGYRTAAWAGYTVEAALFRSDIDNKIQSVANVAGTRAQMQNVGEARASGVELGLEGRHGNHLRFGASYSYIDLDNRSAPASKLTDVPQHKLIAHLGWRPFGPLEFIGLVEHNSRRWTSNTVSLAGFTVVNVKAVYTFTADTRLEAGVDNLSDRNYSLADGFPSAGRSSFVQFDHRF